MTFFFQFLLHIGIDKSKKKVLWSILQARDIVPWSVSGVAACGRLSGRFGLLRAGGSSWGWQGRRLLPPWVRGVHFAKLALHPHLQKLKEMVCQKKVLASKNTCTSIYLF